uniref:Uncharacterized protein n=1 Tax=Nelumbo nucifera TaxID=4432 RepID=A0A822XI08_NELNU|nr:TPA_asm: hypothetical protein HUJ06_020099 [Nelumbo nucifera]
MKIACITTSNEVLTFKDTFLTEHLLPAMQSVHTALVNLGLHKNMSVTTAHSEAGWPSKGDEDEAGATSENTRKLSVLYTQHRRWSAASGVVWFW